MSDPITVGVVGAGRVGTAIGAALTAAGHRVSIGSVPDRTTDLLLLTVPDDALAAVVADLATAASPGLPRPGPPRPGPPRPEVLRPGVVVAHTSGTYGLAVLDPATARGARPLALHPAMTFTGAAGDLERLPGISYGVTAPDDLRPFATRLVADLGGTVEWIAEADRPLYHAALAHGANHLVTLVNDAADLLRAAGVRRPERLLAPLLRAALENTLRLGDAALTGPVARGDTGTLTRHLAVLGRTAPDSVAAYRALARRTADRAVAAGRLPAADAAALREALALPVAEPA
jgi:predicted short-subunit dehydrogenase-like oxidoreductase (DUF2520 family)